MDHVVGGSIWKAKPAICILGIIRHLSSR
jgi:hypothetical protein